MMMINIENVNFSWLEAIWQTYQKQTISNKFYIHCIGCGYWQYASKRNSYKIKIILIHFNKCLLEKFWLRWIVLVPKIKQNHHISANCHKIVWTKVVIFNRRLRFPCSNQDQRFLNFRICLENFLTTKYENPSWYQDT